MNVNSELIYDLARKAVGLVLIAGGAFTLSDSARAIQSNDLATLLVRIVSVLECLGGFWLLRSPSERTRSWAIAAFMGLWVSSLAQLVLGRCSSGRFGAMVINPWFALIFDLAAVVILLQGRPSRERPTELSIAGIAGQVILAIFLAVSGIWTQPPVVISGLATFKGEPLDQGHVIFVGESVRVVVDTDRNGRFRLPPVRPGPYRVMIGGKPALPRPMPDPAQSNTEKTDSDAKRRQAPRAAIRAKAPRNARQSPVEPVRPRGDAGILSWDAPPCCGEAIPFHFSAADSRRAIGW